MFVVELHELFVNAINVFTPNYRSFSDI